MSIFELIFDELAFIDRIFKENPSSMLIFGQKSLHYKGQSISKCPFGNIVWTKNQRNYFWISALIFFVASWGLPGRFFGLPGASWGLSK